MRMKTILLFSALLLCLGMYAQSIKVQGRVTDEQGAAVPAATISTRDSKKAIGITGNDGTFSITVPSGEVLMITAVGFLPAETIAQPTVTVSLKTDVNTLTDVVVTGVGAATSKRKVAIDVASVSAKDFAKSATTSIEQALSGQIAGAQITQTSGQPGAAFNIILRGVNSLGSTTPLILVDGVETRDLTSLDPANVDHIEVVKGAAGGTLYGAQGANGVIQIFTKKGSLDSRLSINASSKVSVDNALIGNDILAKYHHYVTDGSGNILDASGNVISRDATGAWNDPAVPDPTTNPDLTNDQTFGLPTYDHFEQAFRQALTTTNTISLSGGGKSTDYLMTASRLDQQDVFSNKFTRNNFSVNLGFHPFKGFTLRSISQVIVGSENLLNGNRFAVINAYPWVDLNWRDSTGHRAIKTSNSSNQNNSLSEQEWHQRSNNSVQIVQNINANYKFARFVELDFKYGINYSTTDGRNYFLNQSAALQPSVHWGPDREGSITNSYGRDTYQNALSSLFFRTDFQKDFHLNIPVRTTTQVSYDWRSDNYRSYYAQGIQLPIYPPANINVAQVKNDGDYYSAFTTFGVLINQTFDIGNIAGISGGFRSDYSSEFGAGSKPFTFPRGTVYFRPSELFARHAVLVDWKLRGAYGEAGIQPDRYQRQVTLGVNTLGSGVALSLPTVASNANLRVQVSKELEVGTDATFNLSKNGDWLHRVNLNATYWKRKSSDIIQNADVAASSGFNNRVDNLTTISSRGVDIALDATMYSTKNITWNMAVRWGTTKSVVDKISNGLRCNFR